MNLWTVSRIPRSLVVFLIASGSCAAVAHAVEGIPSSLRQAIQTSFLKETELKASDAVANYGFGEAVAVSGDTAVIGSPGDSGAGTFSGSAYVFVKSRGIWSLRQKLTAGDGAALKEFGQSVAVSGDTAVIGSPGDSGAGTFSGSAYVFVRSRGIWSLQQKLTAGDGAALDEFGWSVAVEKDTAVVGSPGNDDAGNDSGSAYVFARRRGIWTQQQKLAANDAAANDEFGLSVAVSGDTVVVGCPRSDGNGAHFDAGSAYVFVRREHAWSQQQKLTAADAAAGDLFGVSVALSDDLAVVGSPLRDDAGSSSGAAYAFARSRGVWTQQQKLTAGDAASDDEFGYSVGVSGETAVIGTPFHDDGGADSGSAYVFVRTGTVWSQLQRLTASDATVGDLFGFAVAIGEDTILAGAPSHDSGGTNSGSAYIYEP